MKVSDRLLYLKSLFKNVDKQALLNNGLDIKLDRTDKLYQNMIERNIEYLLYRNNTKVIRNIEKYYKKKAKENEKKLNGWTFNNKWIK